MEDRKIKNLMLHELMEDLLTEVTDETTTREEEEMLLENLEEDDL